MEIFSNNSPYSIAGIFLPAGNREQVAGDRDRLVESVELVTRWLGLIRLGEETTRHNRQGRGDVEVQGALDIRCVLTREYRPGVDGLTLRNWSRVKGELRIF